MTMNFFKKLLRGYRSLQRKASPQINLVWGFFVYTILGWLILCIPWFHRESVPMLDNLFTSTSAISTTGLVTVSIDGSYNLAGQMVILLLFQVGGIGYMTLTTYYLLFTTRRITNWHQKMIGTAFTMPQSIQVKDFIKSVIYFTVIMEVLGAIGLFIGFHHAGVPFWEAVWSAIFHSISAFCTAGFGLDDNSFIPYQNNVWINVVISILAIAGSLGFIVITDLWYRLRGKTDKISFTTKIIAYGFLLLLSFGTLLTWLTEPGLFEQEHAFMKAFFQAMTAMTTVGFSTIPTSELSHPVLLLILFLMYVGASPSGTAGGMKITTLTAMLSVLKSRLLGQRRINFLGREIPFNRLYVATSTFILYTCLIFFFAFLMTYSEDTSFEKILFEVASALGTVGLSAGLTGNLSVAGKIMIILLMFIGRVGVLTFGFALLDHKSQEEKDKADKDLEKEDLAV